MQVPHSPQPIAVTMGDPRGIGFEITTKAWLERKRQNLPPFILIGSADPRKTCKAKILSDVPIQMVDELKNANEVFNHALPVYTPMNFPPSDTNATKEQLAASIFQSIETAVELCEQQHCRAIVTNPIHKKSLWDAGFSFPGHTEFLEKLCSKKNNYKSVMMLMNDKLKVIPLTIHIALSQVASTISTQMIVEIGELAAKAMQSDFKIEKPKIAVAALNPHGGEDGGLGREEIEIIQPAIDILKNNGIAVSGPFPADTLFHEERRTTYDVCLCMYHDQALIPLKTIDFHTGVNVTLGLPIVRTSPDHGTAFDIAGQNRADPSSFIQAIKVAGQISERRHSAAA